MLQYINSVSVARQKVQEFSLGKTSLSLQRQFGSQLSSSERIYNITFKIVILLRSYGAGFFDKRDTIYRFLGLLSAVLPPITSSPIYVDYNLSKVDVFTNEVWNIVSNMPYSDVLSAT
jgi:hypothetical protein